MSHANPSASNSPPLPAAAEPPISTSAGSPSSRPAASAPLWPLMLFALAGGALAYGLLQHYDGKLFQIPDDVARQASMVGASSDAIDAAFQARLAQDYRNTAMLAAILGGCLAGSLGLGAGIARKSAVGACLGLLLGAALGAALGAGGGLAATWTEARLVMHAGTIYRPMLTQGILWLLISAAAGVTAPMALGRFGRTGHALAAALGSGLAAAVLYPFLTGVAEIVLPGASTDLKIPPGGWTRLLWIELGAVLIAACIGRAATRGRTSLAEH